MLVKEAAAHIQKDGLPKIAVLWGSDPYIRKAGTQRLIDAAGVQLPEMNVLTFEGRADLKQVRDALARVPFMSPSKAVVLEDTDVLSSSTRAASALRPLEDVSMDPGTLFVITTPDKLDRRKNYVKALLKSALVVECEPLKGDALVRFIVAAAGKRGLHIGRTAAELLSQYTEGDLYAAETELDKLASVLTGQVTQQDIRRYVPANAESNMFEIVDLFMRGKWKQAYGDVELMFSEGSSPHGFLAFLSNTFRQMLIARACRDAGFSVQRTISCICDETGVREWAARKAYDRSAHFTASKLRSGIQLLGDVDFGSKQGQLNLSSDMYALLSRLFEMP